MLQSTFQQIVITVLHVTQYCVSIVELHLSGLIGTASHPDKQKIQVIGVFFENELHCHFEVRLLLFTAYTVPASKPLHHA